MGGGIIVADGLSKAFGKSRTSKLAVSEVSFDVEEGQIVALLGPNGAGKTTLFRMLATLLRPSSGRAVIGGADVHTSPSVVRRMLGYVPQSSPTPTRALTVAEELISVCRLQGIDRQESRYRAEEVLTAFGMLDLRDADLRRLSGGQRRRVEVALGVVHHPRVLLLDEPTTGLDPDAREDVWRHLRRLRNREGLSILISTHYLDEADYLADELIALNRGRVITRGAPQDLKRSLAGDAITVRMRGWNGASIWPLGGVRGLPGVRSVESSEDRLILRVSDAKVLLVPVAEAFREAGVAIESMTVERASLRDVFAELIGDERG
jgi:ABC-2 type transport system ATP-binding protein